MSLIFNRKYYIKDKVILLYKLVFILLLLLRWGNRETKIACFLYSISEILNLKIDLWISALDHNFCSLYCCRQSCFFFEPFFNGSVTFVEIFIFLCYCSLLIILCESKTVIFFFYTGKWFWFLSLHTECCFIYLR